ncbi:MAG: CobD/CbiB family protein [Sideroxydans sp.]|nr:CobD/CbiB family protein [Sideroxydans sp.]
MSLLALIAALLLEQMHPLASRKYLSGWMSDYANFFRHNFNAGEHAHGRIAWLLAVLPPVFGCLVLYLLLRDVNVVFAWAFSVLVLYLTMGFRRFSHYFTDINQALRNDDLERARVLLSEWRGEPCHELNAEEVARLTIEQGLLASHRHVFGVMVWFIILGPAGAVLYRLVHFFKARWNLADDVELGNFGEFARAAYYCLEWLPLRLTAITFAIVGDFEDAIYCWRSQADAWPDAEDGIVLASGAGALGVQLGQPIPQGGLPFDRPELGIGDPADVDFMQSTVGLVWRALVFWMLMLLLLELAKLAG